MEATMITSPFPLSIDQPREDGSRLQGRVLIEPAARIMSCAGRALF
jgi:hypothetical protein